MLGRLMEVFASFAWMKARRNDLYHFLKKATIPNIPPTRTVKNPSAVKTTIRTASTGLRLAQDWKFPLGILYLYAIMRI